MRHTTTRSLLVLLLALTLAASGCAKPKATAPSQPATPPAAQSRPASVPDAPAAEPIVATITVTRGALLERDIVPQLAKAFSLSTGEVKAILASAESDLINDKVTGFRRMEGMIPPGEYPVHSKTTLDEMVTAWVAQSERRLKALTPSDGQLNNLTPRERLILASVVEAECLSGKHREQVADVFLNRLAKNSRMQSCVTAEYALGYQRPYLLNRDVAVKSPYNTYQVWGVPVGPISAVSTESISAAMKPSSDPDVYYFYYDYIRNDVAFFSDYAKFRRGVAQSRGRFEHQSSMDPHDKINKQKLYGASVN